MQAFSPREIVSELDRYIIGQDDAKIRSYSIGIVATPAITEDMREEVLPKIF